MSDQKTPSVRDLTGAIWRHKKKAFLFVVATVSVVFVYLLLTPKKYQSDAKLFFRLGRENVGVDPTVLSSQTMSVQMTRSYEINSAIEMINSRTLIGKAVDELGVETVLAQPEGYPWLSNLMAGIKDLKQSVIASFRPSSAVSVSAGPRDEAILKLQKCLDVTSPRETTVIKVSCETHSPKLAQKIVSKVVDVYIGEHMRFHRTSGSLELFASQTELLEQQLAGTNQELSELKSRKEIVSIEGRLQQLEAQKSDIESEQLRTDRQFASAEARFDALKESVESLDEMVLSQRAAVSNDAVDGMRQQLYNLEITERELVAKYSEDHPLLQAARRQVETVRSVLAAEQKGREHSTFAVNPNWVALQLRMLDEASQLAALASNRDALNRQRVQLVRQIKDVNSYATEVAKLQRKADLFATSHKTYSENLEQARIDAAIEDQRISNVSVVQEATLVGEPVGASKRAVAAFGLLAAMLGGSVLAWSCEYFDPRLKSPTEVEQVLELPVLISIPRSSRHRVHV